MAPSASHVGLPMGLCATVALSIWKYFSLLFTEGLGRLSGFHRVIILGVGSQVVLDQDSSYPGLGSGELARGPHVGVIQGGLHSERPLIQQVIKRPKQLPISF